MKCKHCQYEWTPRKDNPVACPRCKMYIWEKDHPQTGSTTTEESKKLLFEGSKE